MWMQPMSSHRANTFCRTKSVNTIPMLLSWKIWYNLFFTTQTSMRMRSTWTSACWEQLSLLKRVISKSLTCGRIVMDIRTALLPSARCQRCWWSSFCHEHMAGHQHFGFKLSTLAYDIIRHTMVNIIIYDIIDRGIIEIISWSIS